MNGLVHNPRMQFLSLGSSRIEVFECYFFVTVITSYDHPRDANKLLIAFTYFSPYLGIVRAGGGVS